MVLDGACLLPRNGGDHGCRPPMSERAATTASNRFSTVVDGYNGAQEPGAGASVNSKGKCDGFAARMRSSVTQLQAFKNVGPFAG